jgi:hypothetical protein
MALFALALAALGVLGLWGCNEGGTPVAIDEPPAKATVPDLVEETDGGKYRFYDPWNPYTTASIDRLLERSDVDELLVAFEDRGLQLSAQNCVVIEGDDRAGSTRATLIALAPPDDTGSEFAVLACLEHNGAFMTAPALFTNAPTKPDAPEVAPGLWLDTGPVLTTEEAARWEHQEWNLFWRCMVMHAPGPMATCTVYCAIMGPAYMQCTFTCVAAQALGAMVRCVASVMVQDTRHADDRPRVE